MSNQLLLRRRAMLRQNKEITLRGIPPITIKGKRNLLSVKAFGNCVQNGTPTPDNPVDIVCNNGVLKVNNQGNIYADGTVETIQVIGKNLFNENDVILGYFYENNGTYTSNSNTFTSGKIPMNAGTTVTFSRGLNVNNSYLRIHAFNSNNEWVGLVAKSASSSGLSATGTTPANTLYIRVCGAKRASGNEIDKKCQVELGSTATAYVPYFNGGTATAEMLLKVGDYTDVQSIIDGVVTRNVGVQVFDGSEIFIPVNNTFRYGLNGLPINNKVMCNYFDGNVEPSVRTSNQPDLTVKGNDSTNNTVYFKYAAKTTVEDFQQWLADQYAAGTPVIVVYALETPTTEQVAGQTLSLTSGTNIIDITQASLQGLELEVKAK